MNNQKRVVETIEEEEVVQVSKSSRELTLFMEGELNARDLSHLGNHLVRLAAKGIRHVVVDLSDVGHLDYRGLKPLMDRAIQFKNYGGDIRLTGLSPYLATILRVAGAHTVFGCYREPTSVHEAYAGRSKLAH